MRRLLERWREARTTIVAGFGRFPVAILALAIFAITVNLEIAQIVALRDEDLVRAGFALVGGAVAATAAVLFGERRRTRPIARHVLSLLLAAAIGVALWYWERLAIAFPALFVAAVVTIPLAPYARREPRGFWAFIWRLIHALALAFIAVIVFCAGLSAIFASIDYLFNVEVDSSLYGHIWSIGLGFVGPLFALSLIPASFPEDDTPDRADIFVVGLRILSDFVAVPLLAAYVVILHVYALKILIETELPKGQIGWMVLSFGLAVLALRVVVHPLAGLAWMPTRLFLRFWPVGLVVPLVLLVIALWQRIDTYGVTPERYALGLFALFLGLVLLAQVSRLRGDIRIIPALGALALFVGSFGPWGMFALSAQSQMDRLMHHLEDAGVLKDGKIGETPNFSRGTAEDVRSIIQVLSETRQLDRLRPLFASRPDDPFVVPAGESRHDRLARIWATFNVKTLPPKPGEEGTFAIRTNQGAVSIEGYDVVVPDLSLTGQQSGDVTLGEGLPTVRTRSSGALIEIESGGVQHTIGEAALREALRAPIANMETRPADEPIPPFLVDLQLDGRKVGLLFRNATGRLTESSLELSAASFDLYLRRSDWR